MTYGEANPNDASGEAWGSGGVGVGRGNGGTQLLDYNEGPRVVRLTDTGANPYSGVPQYLDGGTGVWADLDSSVAPALTGMLYELSGSTAVPIDTPVLAYPNPTGPGFVFAAGNAVAFDPSNPSAFTKTVTYVSNVCPVFKWLGITAGKPVLHDAEVADSVQIQVGEIVEKRTLTALVGATIGDPACVTDSAACCLDWYCVAGAAASVAKGAVEPVGATAGPYPTAEEALAACSSDTVQVTCGACTVTFPKTVYLNYVNKTGFCTGFPNSVPMVWSDNRPYLPRTGAWQKTGANVEVRNANGDVCISYQPGIAYSCDDQKFTFGTGAILTTYMNCFTFPVASTPSYVATPSAPWVETGVATQDPQEKPYVCDAHPFGPGDFAEQIAHYDFYSDIGAGPVLVGSFDVVVSGHA